MFRSLILLAGIGIGVALFDFATRNREAFAVKVPFLGTYWLPAGLGLIGAFLIGVAIPLLLSLPADLRNYLALRRKNKRIEHLERELDQFKNLPFDPGHGEKLRLPGPGQTAPDRNPNP